MPSQQVTQQSAPNRPLPAATIWSAAHVSTLTLSPEAQLGVIGAENAQPLLPDVALWDIWPVQTDDGSLADIAGGSLWVMLSAPREADPDARHNKARMRLIQRTPSGWLDCGDLLPDGFSPGSREWSGSTRINTQTGDVTLWFTAAGRRGEINPDAEQRLFQAMGKLDVSGALPVIAQWCNLTESVQNDGTHYADLNINKGVPGRIKGFRDPYWFRDPATGKGYVLFTGSKSAAQSQSDYDGVIGVAEATDIDGFAPFALLPPIIDADGLANELERPHMFVRDGLYYLFWSTQSSVFAHGAPRPPTGLYGMVGPTLFGPFEPLNGSGLVLANPVSEPRQAYAWQVLPSLDVVSFVDFWGLKNRDITSNPDLKAAHFGGTIAPMVKIEINGKNTRIIQGGA
jgi:levansucrase